MNIKIEINCDNAAFEDGQELAHILHRVANKTHSHTPETLDELDGLPIMDSNGNRVGKITATE